MATRNSVYLEQKAQGLQKALKFFIENGHGSGRGERLLAFLDQIDFWDWEIEELCFSFKNFQERSAAFDTTVPGERAASQGIMVKDAKARDVGYDRRHGANLDRLYGMRATGRVPVVAPTEALEATLAIWHEVLTAAEKAVMATPAAVENAERAGVAGYQKDLSRFRKTLDQGSK